jgi:hypothetical protein
VGVHLDQGINLEWPDNAKTTQKIITDLLVLSVISFFCFFLAAESKVLTEVFGLTSGSALVCASAIKLYK